jgi:hypothetical protein
MALSWRFRLIGPAVCVASALVVGGARPAHSQSATTQSATTRLLTTTSIANPQSATPPSTTVNNLEAPVPLEEGPPLLEGDPGVSQDNPYPATPVVVNGPTIAINTEQATAAVFAGSPGQSISVQSNRSWSLQDPRGNTIASDELGSIRLTQTGRYVIQLKEGLKPPAQVAVKSIDPNALVIPMTLGTPITFRPDELRTQLGRVAVTGGQRYRLVMPPGQGGGRVCLSERERAVYENEIVCADGVQTATNAAPRTEVTFALDHDATVQLQPTGFPADASGIYPVIAAIEVAENDIIGDVKTNPILDTAPAANQSIVIPFWGSPGQRAVISSPDEAAVQQWGDPWIDKEGTTKVSAVPVVYSPDKPPFVSWRTIDRTQPNKRRFGVYRGEEVAVTVPTTGDPVTLRNDPWFAAVASLKLNPGDRYVLQVTGTSIRPVSLALRDPSGKFSSALSPWQWTEDAGKQRAVTGFTADRAGLWALELRPTGNSVKDMSVSLLRVGGGGSYEGSVEIDDVLTIGEKTDIQLGPNEFARLTVKLKQPIPQIVQPEVLRYRNNTFQPTAVDISLWDYKGRLVWSNNRNLEEEVLSGRLGKEPQLSERFATVASPENYTLVVDPKTDLAGRFRIGITSTAVLSDVPLGNGAIPVLLDGTKTGVVEVATPTRYRLTGAQACVSSTSFAEWQKNAPCVADGNTVSLPVGVHRLTFGAPVKGSASFAPVPDGTAPDPLPTATVAVGSATLFPVGSVVARMNIDLNAGDRVVPTTQINFETRTGLKRISVTAAGAMTYPDGSWTAVDGIFVATVAGRYTFTVSASNGGTFAILRAPVEVQATTIGLGAKFKLYKLQSGQRFEATVKVAKRTRIGFDTFGYVQFLYAADSKERRFAGADDLVLDPGTYRFVFVGSDDVRIALKRLPLNLG